jgi:hypothetical protein
LIVLLVEVAVFGLGAEADDEGIGGGATFEAKEDPSASSL